MQGIASDRGVEAILSTKVSFPLGQLSPPSRIKLSDAGISVTEKRFKAKPLITVPLGRCGMESMLSER